MSFDYEFDILVDDIINDHINYNEDVDDILHRKLDYYVSCNDYRKNIEIIDDVVGDVFEAIKRYKNTYGDINTDDCTKSQFYAMLTYCVLCDLLHAKLEVKIDDD